MLNARKGKKKTKKTMGTLDRPGRAKYATRARRYRVQDWRTGARYRGGLGQA